MTSKVGRNEPCPCGSGKKFKRCCLARVEEVERAERLEEERAQRAVDERDEREDEIHELVAAGRFDEAEAAARRIEIDDPGETVGIELLGKVYEARGLEREASEQYRRAVAKMDEMGAGRFCDCCRARMVRAIIRLDPEGPAPALGRDPQ